MPRTTGTDLGRPSFACRPLTRTTEARHNLRQAADQAAATKSAWKPKGCTRRVHPMKHHSFLAWLTSYVHIHAGLREGLIFPRLLRPEVRPPKVSPLSSPASIALASSTPTPPPAPPTVAPVTKAEYAKTAANSALSAAKVGVHTAAHQVGRRSELGRVGRCPGSGPQKVLEFCIPERAG